MQHERLVARVFSTVDSPFKCHVLALGKHQKCGEMLFWDTSQQYQPPTSRYNFEAYSRWIPQMGETSPRLGLETNFEDIVPWRLLAGGRGVVGPFRGYQDINGYEDSPSVMTQEV